MSELPDIEWHCWRKRRYATQEGAWSAAQHFKTLGYKLNTYRCVYCKLWHNGRPSKGKARHKTVKLTEQQQPH